MKPYEEQNDYELLGLRPDASPLEIQRAFQENFELYRPESLASYSFFTDEERKNILSRLETAYLRLSDCELRRAYDGALIESGWMKEEMQFLDQSKIPVPLYGGTGRTVPAGHFAKEGASAVLPQGNPTDHPAVRELLQRDTLTGCDLKAIRNALGVSLDSIAQEIKVKPGILEAIEEDRYEGLPPLAYLKGFIRAYARCLRMGEQAVESYFRHLNPATTCKPSWEPAP